MAQFEVHDDKDLNQINQEALNEQEEDQNSFLKIYKESESKEETED